MARNDNIIVGLDIGTTKVCALIGEIMPDGDIKIIGVGRAASEGLRQGVVINFEKTVRTISHAIREAELQADVVVERVFAGIAGEHIRSINSRGVITVSNPDNEITRADVQRVINTARQVAIPLDRQVIHAIPQEFKIDDQAGIREPVGLSGMRLEAIVHIVTGAVTSAHNIVKCVKRAGYEVADLVLEPIASADAVLTDDEREVGVILLDIGGGTTDYALFYQGAVRHSGVVPVGGDFVTRDLAFGLRTSHAHAERIKREFGSCDAEAFGRDEIVVVPSLSDAEASSANGNGQSTESLDRPLDRSVRRSVLAEIIGARVEETFQLVRRELRRSEYLDFAAGGMVLTGGASQLHGILGLGERVFQMPVRRGLPRGVVGLTESLQDPGNATGIGILKYGAKHRNERLTETVRQGGLFRAVMRRMKRMVEWF